MVDWDQVARELVRALRGGRSQVQLSRMLGYRTNVVYRWEAGRRWPTGSETLRLAERVGVSVATALDQIDRPAARIAAAAAPPTTITHLAAFLDALRGERPVASLAERVGVGESALRRILRGTAEPSLPMVLALLDAVDERGSALVAALVPPSEVPSLPHTNPNMDQSWPFAGAISALLRIGELDPARIAGHLGTTEAHVRDTLAMLEDSGRLQWVDGAPTFRPVVRMIQIRDRATSLTTFWSAHLQRLPTAKRGYLIGTVTEAQLAELDDLHRRFLQDVQAVMVRSGTAGTRAVAVAIQHASLDGGPLGTMNSAPSGRGGNENPAPSGRAGRETGGR
ncbi:MAG: helix-turn-helix transcriptional regulator [Myxococcota bacterium]